MTASVLAGIFLVVAHVFLAWKYRKYRECMFREAVKEAVKEAIREEK